MLTLSRFTSVPQSYCLLERPVLKDFLRSFALMSKWGRKPIIGGNVAVQLSSEEHSKPGHDSNTEKTPVIVLHGLLGSKNNWYSVSKHLVEQFNKRRIIAADLRNHGESPWTQEFNYTIMVGDMLKLLEQQNLEKASFIGHSMGGRVAMLLAIMYPEKVESLVVVDIVPLRNSDDHNHVKEVLKIVSRLDLDAFLPISEARKRAADQLKSKELNMQLINFITSNIVKNEDDRASWRWKFNLDSILTNFEKQMTNMNFSNRSYNGPALFIGGGKSNFMIPDDVTPTRTLFPNSSFEFIPEAGHLVHIDSPAKFVPLVATFLNNH